MPTTNNPAAKLKVASKETSIKQNNPPVVFFGKIREGSRKKISI